MNSEESKKLVFQLIVGKVKLINDDQKYLQAGSETEQFVSVDKTIRLASPPPSSCFIVITEMEIKR